MERSRGPAPASPPPPFCENLSRGFWGNRKEIAFGSTLLADCAVRPVRVNIAKGGWKRVRRL